MATYAHDPDINLVQSAKNGDSQAFEKLVMQYQNRIFNTVLRMLGDYEAALDLTQETFLRAYQGLARFKQESTFFTWLFRICLNVATSQRRLYAHHGHPISINSTNDEENTNWELESKEAQAEVNLVQKEIQSAVQKAIATLPYEFREALVLRDIEGLSYEQIQEILDCPLGTVRSRIHRGRAMLKEKLLEFDPNL